MAYSIGWKVDRERKNFARHCLQKLNVNLSLKLLPINGATEFIFAVGTQMPTRQFTWIQFKPTKHEKELVELFVVAKKYIDVKVMSNTDWLRCMRSTLMSERQKSNSIWTSKNANFSTQTVIAMGT